MTAPASADAVTITPDPPPRRQPPSVGPSNLRPTWDLDGLYLWLGPVGAASRLDAAWDSTFGADLVVARVREHAPLAVLGANLGASKWTARDGERVWLDLIGGVRLGDRIYGWSAGSIIEFADLEHPRVGGSIGIWGFFGIVPFVRAGVVDEAGGFVEAGIHIALPVLRR